jgi:amidophosphoribosyltransferase
LTPDELYAVRDPRGFRPLNLAKFTAPNGEIAWIVASETCAFDLLNAQYVREIESGEMLRISKSGLESIHFAPEKPHQFCIFEHVYFARPDSTIFGRSVNDSREALGRQLAREHPVDADLVVPVPDSGVPAAVGYAMESGIPFRMGLIRNHYIGRTFIEPSQAIRDFGVKLKLNPVGGLMQGRRVVLVDDSIVRGTTSRKIVRMVREAGAKEVHVRISCPPTISPCYYGVDTPTREELIASSNTPEQICRYLGADSLGYISLAGLRQAVNDTQGNFCTSCYTGIYPTDLVQLEVREGTGMAKLAEPAPVTVEHES